MSERQTWAVVGGGILGMTLALRLRGQGKEVTLFEAADGFGGLASAWTIGDVAWDRHYHVTLLSDAHLRALLRELELEDEMNWVETRTGFYTDGKLYSMSNSLEFLKFPPLNLVEKFRLGWTIFYASKLKNWRRLEGMKVGDWLRRISGRGVFEKIWLPLLRAKLGDSYQQASAAFIWAIIARMYAARRSGLKKEMFGYLGGGYGRMLEVFARRLRAKGVELCPATRVERVSRIGSAIRLETSSGVAREFDHVVMTTPAPVIAKTCPDLSDDELQRLNGVNYQGIICASALLKKPLGGFYVTNITDPVPFTAVIEMTALVDPEELGGHHLVYLPKYVDASDAEAFGESDESLRKTFCAALLRMHPHLDEDDVVAFKVSRARHVLALSTLNYSESLPPIDTSIPGVHIVNSALICNGTLNVNETVQLAESAARRFQAAPVRSEGEEVVA